MSNFIITFALCQPEVNTIKGDVVLGYLPNYGVDEAQSPLSVLHGDSEFICRSCHVLEKLPQPPGERVAMETHDAVCQILRNGLRYVS